MIINVWYVTQAILPLENFAFLKGYINITKIWLVVIETFFFFFCISGIDSDIIDEAIYYFKANVFFKNYEIKVRNLLPLAPAAYIRLSFKATRMFKENEHLCA